MGCSSSADSKPQVPQLRRRLSLGDVDLLPEAAAEDEAVSEQDRSLMMQLTQGEIMDFIKSDEMVGRRYSIGSETDQQGRLARSFQDKTVKLQGSQFDTKSECLGYACKKGLKPEAPNQDSFFIMKVADKFSLYGVFDGHGSKGHDVSNFVKDNLPKILLSHDNLLEDPKGVLTKTFEKTQYLIEKATQLKQIDAARSGTTCSVVLHMHKDNMLYVAHVGDSRVVLGKQAMEDGKSTVKAVDLTTDHKPDLPEERKRIEAAGGVVLFDGGWNYRVYARGKKDARGKRYPGLNMSRSMGDLKGFHDAGISAEPDVKSRPLKSAEAGAGGEQGKTSLQPSEPTVTMVSLDPGHDKFVMLCSDGVWEFISSQQAVEMVSKFPPAEAEKAAEHLAAAAWDQWMQELEGQVVDDITSVIVHFTAPKA